MASGGRITQGDGEWRDRDELAGHRGRPAVLSRLLTRLPAGSRSPVARRFLSVAAAVALVAAAVAALHPAGRDVPAAPAVVGLTMQVPGPQPAGGPVGAIRATYRVVPASSGARAALLTVHGPNLGPVEVRAGSVEAPDGGRLVSVSGVADCRSQSALDAGSARYWLTVRTTGLDGTTDLTHLRLPRSPVDWSGAVRQDCWQRVAAAGVRVERVDARSSRGRREVLLDVRLRSALDRDVEIGAVDIADVSTIEPADSGRLPAGGARVLQVRLPLPDCVLDPPGTAGLLWSVGEVGKDVAANFVTALPEDASSALRSVMRDRCSPPGTTIRVVGSRLVLEDAVVRDRHGAAVALRVSVSTGSPEVVLGSTPGRTVTADGRLPTTVARVRPVAGQGTAVVVWHASCAAEPPAPLRLPVRLLGQRSDYAVTVDDPGVARTYARACGLRLADLVAAGWREQGRRAETPAPAAP